MIILFQLKIFAINIYINIFFQFIIYARIIHFYEYNIYNINLIKYIRKHFLNIFNILY